MAGQDPVAQVSLFVEAEVGCTVRDEGIQLFEAAIVEEHFETFPRGELATGVLLFDSGLSPTLQSIPSQLCKACQLIGRRQPGCPPNRGGPSRDRTCDPPVMSRML